MSVVLHLKHKNKITGREVLRDMTKSMKEILDERTSSFMYATSESGTLMLMGGN